MAALSKDGNWWSWVSTACKREYLDSPGANALMTRPRAAKLTIIETGRKDARLIRYVNSNTYLPLLQEWWDRVEMRGVSQTCCKRETRMMTRWSRRCCPLSTRRPMARRMRASRAQEVSVRRAQCCSRCVSEKRPKCARVRHIIEGNQ